MHPMEAYRFTIKKECFRVVLGTLYPTGIIILIPDHMSHSQHEDNIPTPCCRSRAIQLDLHFFIVHVQYRKWTSCFDDVTNGR